MSTAAYSVTLEGDVCRLAGAINFDTAPALLAAVSEHIQPSRVLTLDFSQVNETNSAALALLLEWKELAGAQGCTVNHQNLPDSMRQLSEICQVSSFI